MRIRKFPGDYYSALTLNKADVCMGSVQVVAAFRSVNTISPTIYPCVQYSSSH
jgi:hypothetical protein